MGIVCLVFLKGSRRIRNGVCRTGQVLLLNGADKVCRVQVYVLFFTVYYIVYH